MTSLHLHGHGTYTSKECGAAAVESIVKELGSDLPAESVEWIERGLREIKRRVRSGEGRASGRTKDC